MRTSRWSASSSAGGRVCGVTVVLAAARAHGQRVADHDPAASASSRSSTSTLVPGSYARAVGRLMPNGPSRKKPASRSSRLPNTLGESKRGTHSQSIAPSGATSAPVWQSERNA